MAHVPWVCVQAHMHGLRAYVLPFHTTRNTLGYMYTEPWLKESHAQLGFAIYACLEGMVRIFSTMDSERSSLYPAPCQGSAGWSLSSPQSCVVAR